MREAERKIKIYASYLCYYKHLRKEYGLPTDVAEKIWFFFFFFLKKKF